MVQDGPGCGDRILLIPEDPHSSGMRTSSLMTLPLCVCVCVCRVINRAAIEMHRCSSPLWPQQGFKTHTQQFPQDLHIQSL